MEADLFSERVVGHLTRACEILINSYDQYQFVLFPTGMKKESLMIGGWTDSGVILFEEIM